MNKTISSRAQIDPKYQWQIQDIYTSDQLWEQDFLTLKESLSSLSNYKESLISSAQSLYDYLHLKDQLSLKLERIYVYAHQKNHEDLSNPTYQDFASRATSLSTAFNKAISFEAPKILELSLNQLQAFIKEHQGLTIYEQYLMDAIRQKPHILSDKEEALLASVNDMATSSKEIFTMLNNIDFKFPAIENDGTSIEVTHGNFISLLENPDRNIRKEAFSSVYQTYEKFRNTLAAIYSANLKKTYFYAKARHFNSSLEMSLFQNNIPTDVYQQLIDTVHQYLPVMHRYIQLRQKILAVDTLHMYDLFVPLVKESAKHYSFEEAKSLVLEGLNPMGSDYIDLLKQGFDNGWIDIYENINKRSGAYSWGVYDVHPYVLLNYQDNLDNVFTLAHEMGHALHSHYSNTNQEYINSDYCIFSAEVASICNESLLMNHLINHSSDKNLKIYLLNHYLNNFRSTLFRQTMFAEFEQITHQMIADGKTLTADLLCQTYHQLNIDYYGNDIVVDQEIAMEWARIPHFYTPFYVYQYATGFSAATAIAKKILNEGDTAVDNYKKFLKSGGRDYPIELLKIAGVDMTKKEPIESAMKTFENILAQLESLLNE